MTYTEINKLESLMERLNLKVRGVRDMRHDINPVQLEKLMKAVEKAVKIKMLGNDK